MKCPTGGSIHESVHAMSFTYRGARTSQISFPLGGMGTGCIGLAGNGRLIDWEIFNKPSKNSVNGFSHFAIKAEAGGRVLDARVLQGDLPAPYTGESIAGANFGFGPRRETLAGLPHFRRAEFTGTYPIARMTFADPKFPGRVALTAFNPLIPLNDGDSGIPAAFFEFEIRNPTRRALTYTLAGTLGNPLPANQVHTVTRRGGHTLLHLACDSVPQDDPRYGTLTLATDAQTTSHQQYWFRGKWFDSLEVYWRDLTMPGPLRNRRYGGSCDASCSCASAGEGNQGLLAAHVTVAPGRTARVRFVISWNFPVCENYWFRKKAVEEAGKAGISPRWRNYYATLWKDSPDSARYALKHWDRLYRETRLFRDTLFASTLPEAAIDAVSANLSILKSPTVLRLEDGTFYGFEGCHCTKGCCEGTCTHVWHYAQALPFLFPKLERSVREADYRYNQQPNGGMPFRLQLPLGITHPGGRSCADGLFGNVMMVYRDWKIAGDSAWLRKLWPAVKKSIEFAWDPSNEDQWDPEKTGVIHGRHHHTLDMELFGPNSWLTGFYLGALKAGAEMAEALSEPETAREYRAIFARGKAWTDRHLFNGRYYHQRVDVRDISIPRRFDALEAYWNDQHGEIKYQIAEGCALDQTLAQWHANLYGLGEIFDPAQARKALKSIFRHNFKKSMREYANPCRLYTLNDEAGLVICDWPEGARKPAIPLTYSQETMAGFEYAAAIQMIQNGMVREGMAAVAAVRARYDGEKRNPWNEIECGSNYARSMASYALLNAFSGFTFDMTKGSIGFEPLRTGRGVFRCLWSLDSGWGEVRVTRDRIELRILGGRLRLSQLAFTAAAGRQAVTVNGRRSGFISGPDGVRWPRGIEIAAGKSLNVRFSTKEHRS